MARDGVLVEKRDGIATLTLNQPERLNAFDIKLIRETFDALAELAADNDAGAVVVTAAGRAFSAGVDVRAKFLDNIEKRKRGEVNQAIKESDIRRGFDSIAGFRKPIIAAINGVAVGLGATLSLACDMRIASENARIGFVFVKMALTPEFGSSYLLPRLIGVGRAFDLLYTGRIVDAREAKEIGLFNQVVPGEKLLETAQALAISLAKGPPVSLKLIREGVYRGLSNSFDSALRWEEFALNICYSTDDHEEAVRAFLEKREPKFRGR
ncbi:MAG: enoyl-CoA hydratase/isomerase family protein [Chloroflexi bacterium]|nr:enoyl-CoA hydratase/isomerase family protein [Chloroflexota bacterium]